MTVGKKMHSSKGLLGQRGSRKVHTTPTIKDLKGKVNAYFEKNDASILAEILWDTILIQDYSAFLSRAQTVIQTLEGTRAFHNRKTNDPYLIDLYLQINENIDYFAQGRNEYMVGAEARKRNYELLTHAAERSWEYHFEKFQYYSALIEHYTRDAKRVNQYTLQSLACIDKIDGMGKFPDWCKLNKFKLQSIEAHSRSALISNMSADYLSYNVISGMFTEKACLMMNRTFCGDDVLEMEREWNKQVIFKKWFDIYSRIIESGRMPSGINKRVYDLIIHYASFTPDMSIDEQIMLHETMYSMKKGLGYYQTGKFTDRANMATPEDPFEYIKDLYYIRGFLKEKKLIGKDLTMHLKDIRIGACKVNSIEDLKKRIDNYKGTADLFYYFAFDKELDDDIVTSILDMFCEKEREINWPATFRLVYKNASGHYICPETLNGMI